jgi:SAM-dependent methyltransferase
MPSADQEKNRAAWNEMTEVHFRHPDYKVAEFLQGRSTLRSIELDEVGNVAGKKLLHLMCQFGLDTLSWARRGAVVTGVDISDRSIERANELKDKTNLPATFIRSDILELIGKIEAKFDIVFQSYGIHHWISDLKKWAQTAAHFLKPGGIFYLIDDHPIARVFEEAGESYFDTAPRRLSQAYDYHDRSYTLRSELVQWRHTLSGIVNAVLQTGLTIELLNEFDRSYYPRRENWYEKDGYWYPPDGPSPYPLMFSLRARKSK